mmetsp:Transcript_2906/g.5960  ORF Transcript_2906/g.5960 Transcript_2906/m.5960 type:complete len:83 (-) Transcript_2906:588-836(-)
MLGGEADSVTSMSKGTGETSVDEIYWFTEEEGEEGGKFIEEGVEARETGLELIGGLMDIGRGCWDAPVRDKEMPDWLDGFTR